MVIVRNQHGCALFDLCLDQLSDRHIILSAKRDGGSFFLLLVGSLQTHIGLFVVSHGGALDLCDSPTMFLVHQLRDQACPAPPRPHAFTRRQPRTLRCALFTAPLHAPPHCTRTAPLRALAHLTLSTTCRMPPHLSAPRHCHYHLLLRAATYLRTPATPAQHHALRRCPLHRHLPHLAYLPATLRHLAPACRAC